MTAGEANGRTRQRLAHHDRNSGTNTAIFTVMGVRRLSDAVTDYRQTITRPCEARVGVRAPPSAG
jgi:hypothetical protein